MTRNQKWLTVLLTGSLVVVSPLLYAALADRLTPEYVPPEQPEWVVQSGETLWSIAKAVYPEAVHTGAAVQAIRQANRLRGATIWPGQRLRLPEVR